jgi:hypothetical protein
MGRAHRRELRNDQGITDIAVFFPGVAGYPDESQVVI